MDTFMTSLRPSVNVTAPKNGQIKSQAPLHPLQQPARDTATLKFSGLINKDYSVEIRTDVPVNAQTVSALQRALLNRNLLKSASGSTSSLKCFLDANSANGYRETDKAALADMMLLVDRPVDVIAKSHAGAVTMKAYQSATGKRMMYAGAQLNVGAVGSAFAYGKNKDIQVRRELFTEYLRDMEDLLIKRAGAEGREKAFNDLMSDKEYNALQALHYGSKGLTDVVIVGHDQAITREDLEKYYKKRKFTPEQIEKFNADYMNIYKIAARPLNQVAPNSIPEQDKRVPLYKSLKDALMEGAAKTKKQPGEAKDGATPEPEKAELTFYLATPKGVQKSDKLGNNYKVKEDLISPGNLFVDNVPDAGRGVLDDDVIFFNEGFDTRSAEQIAEALLTLDDKKSAQDAPSNIKIAINSPGGSVWAGQELRSTIHSLKTPVDVIVQGMAASCGTWLLSSATGNRLATPNARLMIHEAAFSTGMTEGANLNQAADDLNQATRDYIAIVADKTGRPFKQVWEDFKLDVWMNPLEGLFYGKNGMIDAILVGPDKAITREDVNRYLVKKLGSQEKVDKYIQQKIKSFREPDMVWKPEDHEKLKANDPFATPLKTIQEVAERYAKPLSVQADLAKSMPRPGSTIDYVIVKGKPEKA